MSVVSFDRVSKRFGGVSVLDELSVTIPDGAFVVMLGPSGCGKTTALRLLAGLEQPSSGSIFFDQREITGDEPRDRDIAMVFQSYALYPRMTVRENIAYPLRVRRVKRAERLHRATEVGDALGLGELMDRRPSQLSGGQRQRVALARAMVRQPACFLMDEPLSNLDAKLRVVMRGEIKSLQRKLGTTTLYVTHDQAEALTMGDLIVVLWDGVLQQVGSPLEVYRNPVNRFVAGFVGSPQMNFLPLSRGEGRWLIAGQPVRGEAPVALAEGGVEVGFRPEDATIVEPQAATCDLVGDVSVVEPMGHETLVLVRIGETTIAVRASRSWVAAGDSRVGLAIDWAGAFTFDAEGVAIPCASKPRKEVHVEP